MAQILVTESSTDDLRAILRADDMAISGCDIAFAGMAFDCGGASSKAFASYIASLSHILTRIVLSDRIVFFYSPGSGSEEPPTSNILPFIEKHCNTVQIDEGYAPVESVIHEVFESPTGVFDSDLVANISQSVKQYAPWSTDDLVHAILAEYGAANLACVPFAPNPFLSKPISIYEQKGKIAADGMLEFVEDLRRETSHAMNLHKRMNIYDLKLPAILAAILRESKDAADLIPVASQMNAEAKAFRSWCQSLEAIEGKNPDKYLDKLQAAKESLRRLGSSLNAGAGERMQVSASTGVLGIDLHTPTLGKALSFLDVDIRFYRPRSFLLNVLSSARQVKKLAPELARVFKVDPTYAQEAAAQLFKLAQRTGAK